METSESNASPCAEILWKEVMNSQLTLYNNYSDSDTWPEIPKLWKQVGKDEAICAQCTDEGGGALIGCMNDRCNRFFHLDCAFQHGGLSLHTEGNHIGLLTYECPSHYKDILFCTCKQKYEDTKPMIFCDNCFDWYHESCEGIESQHLEEMEKYICKSCRSLQRTGKSLSKGLKDKNSEKERRSYYNQSALHAIGILVELTAGTCETLDSLYHYNSDKVSIKDIRDAEKFISSLQFDPNGWVDSNQILREDMEKIYASLSLLGVISLISSWRQYVIQTLEGISKWELKIDKLFTDFFNSFPISDMFQSQQVSAITQALEQLAQSEKESNIVALKDIPEGYKQLLEALQWMLEFLQVIINRSKSDQWNTQITTLTRFGTNKLKKMNSTKDKLCAKFASLLNFFVKNATESVTKAMEYDQRVTKLLNQNKEYRFEDLLALEEAASGLSLLPPSYEKLLDIRAKCEHLRAKVASFLSSSELDDALLQDLKNQKVDLSISLEEDAALDQLQEAAIFLKAYQLSCNEPRVMLHVIDTLLGRAQLLMSTFTSSQTLRQTELLNSVFAKVQQTIESMSSRRENALELVANRGLTDLRERTIVNLSDEEILSHLQAFGGITIILPEEDLLCFLQNAREFDYQAYTILDKSRQARSEESSALIENMEKILSITTIDRFPLAVEQKLSLKKALNSLIDQQLLAEKLLSKVVGAVNDAYQGHAPSKEMFMQLLREASDSIIYDPELTEKANALISESESIELECKEALDQLSNKHYLQSWSLVQRLLDLSNHHLLPGDIKRLIKLRHDVSEVILEGHRLITWYETLEEGTILTEHDIVKWRDVNNKLSRLDGFSNDINHTAVNQAVIDEIKIKFGRYHWLLEARTVLRSLDPVPLSFAEKLLQSVQMLGPDISSSTESVSLQQEVEHSRACFVEGQQLQQELDVLLCQFNESILQHYESSPDMKPSPEDWAQYCQSLEQKSYEEIFGTAPHVAVIQLVKENASRVRQLYERATSTEQNIVKLRLKDESATSNILECVSIILILHDLGSVLVNLDESRKSYPTFVSQNVVDFKDITVLLNRINNLTDSSASNAFISFTGMVLRNLYGTVNRWMDSMNALLPKKITRQRISKYGDPNGKYASRMEVATLLNDHIALMVRTTVHERAEGVLLEAKEVEEHFKEIIFPSDFDKTQNYFMLPDEDVLVSLPDIISRLNLLKQTMEKIPLDLPEGVVLQWTLDVFSWMDGVPFPSVNKSLDGVKSMQLTAEEARRKLVEGIPLLRELSSVVVEFLVYCGVMSLETMSFTEGSHPLLKRSGECFEYLEKELNRTVDWHQRVEWALKNDATTKQCEDLLAEASNLTVIPEISVRRQLEKSISLKPTISKPSVAGEEVQISKTGRTIKKRQSDYYIFYDNTAIDRGTTGQVTVEDVKEKPLKPRKIRECLRKDCGKDVKNLTEVYCSEFCAVEGGGNFLQNILAYYKFLMSSDDPPVSDEIILYYDIISRDHRSIKEVIPVAEVKEAAGNSSLISAKSSGIQAALAQLPTLANHMFIKDINSSSKGGSGHIELTLRERATAALEDFFVKLLEKILPQGGSFGQGLLLAKELEEALHKVYYRRIESEGVSSLDVKEYRKHYQMLLHNLKQPHNESLIMKLVNLEVSMEELLGMSAHQLADTSTQLLRQKQLNTVVEDAHRKSTEEELEAKRREVMAGQAESWRHGGYSSDVTATKVVEVSQVDLPEAAVEPAVDGTLKRSPRAIDGEMSSYELETADNPPLTSRSLSNDDMESADKDAMVIDSQPEPDAEPALVLPLKRSVNVDAGTRFTTNASNKQARIEAHQMRTSLNLASTSADGTLSSTPSTPSGASKLKAPSLLEIVKASNQSSTTPTSSFSQLKSSKKPAQIKSDINYDPPSIRLLSSEGSNSIVITHPGAGSMRATGLINDKRAQGLIKSPLNIVGRTRIAEMDRFVNEVIATNRKLVATAVLLVQKEDHNSYRKLMDELLRGEKAGVSNISPTVQLYIVPPSLRQGVSLLAKVGFPSGSMGSDPAYIFSVLIAKEHGPAAYTNAPNVSVPYDWASFTKQGAPSTSQPAMKEPVAAKPVSTLPLQTNKPLSINTSAPLLPLFSSSSSLSMPMSSLTRPLSSPQTFSSTTLPFSAPSTMSMPMTKSVGSSSMPANIPGSFSGVPPFRPVLSNAPNAREEMRRIAQFIAREGPEKLVALRALPNTRATMPFLYEDHMNFKDFVEELRNSVNM